MADDMEDRSRWLVKQMGINPVRMARSLLEAEDRVRELMGEQPSEACTCGPCAVCTSENLVSYNTDGMWKLFGQSLRVIRVGCNWSLGGLARRMGVSVSAISAMEHGREPERPKVMCDTCDAPAIQTVLDHISGQRDSYCPDCDPAKLERGHDGG